MTAAAPDSGKADTMLRLDPAVGTMVLILAVLVAITYPTEFRWIGHAAVSFSGFILVCAAAFTGAVVKGRIRNFRIQNPYQVHRRISILSGLVITAAFVLGILTTMEHGEPLLESSHGLAGITVVVLCWLQLVPSIVIRERAAIRIPHRITGYILIIAAAFQTVLGLRAAGYL